LRGFPYGRHLCGPGSISRVLMQSDLVQIDILSISADRTTYKGAALTERSQGAGALAPAPWDT